MALTVEYATISGYRPLLLDLHRPAGDAPSPVVLYVHGGGWQQGSRASFGPTYAAWDPSPFARLTAAGLAVASVDYRLSAEATYPAQLDDVTAALGWLGAHAAELRLDPSRVVAWGESAGGHLAALLGLTTPGVTAVVDWYGPADLTTMAAQGRSDRVADPGAPDSREARLLGAPIDTVPERAAAASPVSHVHPGAPPFLLVHGTADRFVPCGQSEQLAEALTKQGVEPEVLLIEGADHMWLGSPSIAEAAFTTSLDFVRRHV